MEWAVRSIYILEKVFLGASILVVIYAVIYFNKPVAIPVVPKVTQQFEPALPEKMQNVTGADVEMAALSASRDLFNTSLTPADMNNVNNPVLPNALPGNFKVVGVILGAVSQLAIEDVNAHQTYFITKGSQAQGIEVIDIHRDQALLKYQGQEITLSLLSK